MKDLIDILLPILLIGAAIMPFAFVWGLYLEFVEKRTMCMCCKRDLEQMAKEYLDGEKHLPDSGRDEPVLPGLQDAHGGDCAVGQSCGREGASVNSSPTRTTGTRAPSDGRREACSPPC